MTNPWADLSSSGVYITSDFTVLTCFFLAKVESKPID